MQDQKKLPDKKSTIKRNGATKNEQEPRISYKINSNTKNRTPLKVLNNPNSNYMKKKQKRPKPNFLISAPKTKNNKRTYSSTQNKEMKSDSLRLNCRSVVQQYIHENNRNLNGRPILENLDQSLLIDPKDEVKRYLFIKATELKVFYFDSIEQNKILETRLIQIGYEKQKLVNQLSTIQERIQKPFLNVPLASNVYKRSPLIHEHCYDMKQIINNNRTKLSEVKDDLSSLKHQIKQTNIINLKRELNKYRESIISKKEHIKELTNIAHERHKSSDKKSLNNKVAVYKTLMNEISDAEVI